MDYDYDEPKPDSPDILYLTIKRTKSNKIVLTDENDKVVKMNSYFSKVVKRR